MTTPQTAPPPTSERQRPQLPPVVYVPTTDEADVASRRVLLHRVEDGRTALYAYSAIDRLHTWYLPDAPWLLCDVAALQRIHDQTPYDLLFLDVDPGLRDDAEETA
ncbi:SAV_915 family protein [Nocardioides sp. SYSU D00065]|uniref:SAV_915 family protein n=1 Tax=Nocardioides sp. SYSU D00065 TaxID=2817378 RepID=UPI001B31F96F|nr:SAV_915 family protein [Nocardioides sp. SYSU D00065]